MMKLNLSLLAVIAAAASACSKADAPKTPLAGETSAAGAVTEAAAPAISGPAKIALDSANLHFRAKSYDQALAQYRLSAEMAPGQISPLLGIMMVADVTNDSSLARATVPRIRKLDPSYADSAPGSHARIMKAHPRREAPPRT
jgi:hypothetical protein